MDGLELAPLRRRKKVQLDQGFSQMDWMKLTQKTTKATSGNARPITMEEVRMHNNMMMDAWMVLRGKVYNVTKYGPYHPGGLSELARGLGDDATALFDEIHPWVSENMLEKFIVGWIVPNETAENTSESAPVQPSSPTKRGGGVISRIGLTISRATKKHEAKGVTASASSSEAHGQSSSPWYPCRIKARSLVSHTRSCILVHLDCRRAPSTSLQLLTQPGVMVKLRKKIDGITYERPFTPFVRGAKQEDEAEIETIFQQTGCSMESDQVTVSLLLKVYKDGRISRMLSEADLGSELEIEVRRNMFTATVSEEKRLHIKVLGSASFRKATSDSFDHVLMIAGGTGIMPMVQLVDFAERQISCGELEQCPSFSLITINRTESDIPLRVILDSQKRLKRVSHVLTQPNSQENWKGFTGRLNEDIVQSHLASIYIGNPAEEDLSTPRIRILVCGSFDFNIDTEKLLMRMGWPASSIIRID